MLYFVASKKRNDSDQPDIKYGPNQSKTAKQKF